jgi:hypothetical protein
MATQTNLPLALFGPDGFAAQVAEEGLVAAHLE